MMTNSVFSDQQRSAFSAHQLRRPINSILQLVQSLKKEAMSCGSQRLQTIVELLSSDVNELSQVASDFLDLAKSNVTLVREPINVPKVMRDLRKAFHNTQMLQLSIESCDQHIWVDHSKFIQILQNLIENGFKYNDNTQPKVHVFCRKFPEVFEFHVVDNGMGITAEQSENVFKPLYRAHNSIPGTGLGTVIAKELVQKHGGDIRFRSTPGAGSDFYFTIPRGRPE